MVSLTVSSAVVPRLPHAMKRQETASVLHLLLDHLTTLAQSVKKTPLVMMQSLVARNVTVWLREQ